MYKIIISPFPFLENQRSKVRPLVILSRNIDGICICGFITSQIPTNLLETDIILKNSAESQNTTGLKKDCVIRLHKLGSIDTSCIEQEIGFLPKELENEIASKIKILFKVN